MTSKRPGEFTDFIPCANPCDLTNEQIARMFTPEQLEAARRLFWQTLLSKTADAEKEPTR